MSSLGERMGENVMEVLRGTLIEIDSVEVLDSKRNKEDTGMYVVKTPGEIDFDFSSKGDMLMIEISERIREMFILYEVICTENGICKQTQYRFKDWDGGNEWYYGDMSRDKDYIKERYYINNRWTPWLARGMVLTGTEYSNDLLSNITENEVTEIINRQKITSSYNPTNLINEINTYANRSDLSTKLCYYETNGHERNEITFNGPVRVNGVLRFNNYRWDGRKIMGITFNHEPKMITIFPAVREHINGRNIYRYAASDGTNALLPENHIRGYFQNGKFPSMTTGYIAYGCHHLREVYFGTGNEDRMRFEFYDVNNGRSHLGGVWSAIHYDFVWKRWSNHGIPGDRTEPVNHGFRVPDWAREVLVMQCSNDKGRQSVRTFWFNTRAWDLTATGTANYRQIRYGYVPIIGFNVRYEAGAKTLRRNYGVEADSQSVHWTKVYWR